MVTAELIEYLTDKERAELSRLLSALPVWMPAPRNAPQCAAFSTPAFETLYGGAAGGGKSDLLLGLARTQHKRSLLLRRTYPDLERSLISRSLEFFGNNKGYNSQKHTYSVDGRRIEYGHMERVGTPQIPGDEASYASAPYDFIAFDQLEQFPEYAYRFMFSRARSANPAQRVRVLSSANPVGEGVVWITKRWAAWLTGKARPGELRYYKQIDDFEVETDANDPDGLSRTFIPAGLKDNPYLGDDYRRTLANLPEPLRSALLNGDWQASLTDDAYQTIPRAWVRAAMERWMPNPPVGPQVIGFDVARGGDDKTVFAPRRGSWFAPLVRYAGRETPDGKSAAALLAVQMTDKDSANIDVIGVGASAYDHAREMRLTVYPVNFSEASKATDKSGTLHMSNKRAECYWAFRDALDPSSGQNIALPPDDELEADLCSPRWSMQTNGIRIEPKEDIKKRIGRSPDAGDAVVLAWYQAATGWFA